MIYAGIGSRETPTHFRNIMSRYARAAAINGDTLRTGGAEGADKAFMAGCGNGRMELYLPWQGYNGLYAPCPEITVRALRLAQRFHPAWDRCSPAAQKLHARNGYIILGADLKSPVDRVVCWTPGGEGGGGTGQALRIARAYGIPVVDLGAWQDRLALECTDEAYRAFLALLDVPSVG